MKHLLTVSSHFGSVSSSLFHTNHLSGLTVRQSLGSVTDGVSGIFPATP